MGGGAGRIKVRVAASFSKMKSHPALMAAACVGFALGLRAAEPARAATLSAKLVSTIFDFEKMAATTTPNGARRNVIDGATTTLDKLHVHVTTLNPGKSSGEPRPHPQEELIVVKDGLVEAHVDGKTQTAGPGSVFFFAANAVTRLRNAGDTPATYVVINYYAPATPKQ